MLHNFLLVDLLLLLAMDDVLERLEKLVLIGRYLAYDVVLARQYEYDAYVEIHVGRKVEQRSLRTPIFE